MLPQVLKIIFKVQRKISNEKITKREISFPIYKTHFFFFGPFLLSNLITFLFLINFKWFKVLLECHLKFHKLSLNSNNNKKHTRNFVGVWELAFVTFGGLFFEFLTFLFWRAITFSILFHFWRFLVH